MLTPAVLVWFRDDLRITDNPALTEAMDVARSTGASVHAVYLAHEPGPRAHGAASLWWRHQALGSLAESLAQLGVQFHIVTGDALSILPQLVQRWPAQLVVVNRRYEPAAAAIDERVRAAVLAHGAQFRDFPGYLLAEPGDISTATGGSYQVFSPFFRRLSELLAEVPVPELPAPQPLTPGTAVDNSAALRDINQLGWQRPWADSLAQEWTAGEAAALAELELLPQRVHSYAQQRDFPAITGTSLLSPRLRVGELSVGQVWNRSAQFPEFRRQLGWRDFAWHRLAAHPQLAQRNIRPDFDHFPWDSGGQVDSQGNALSPDAEELSAWCQGRTGIELVDAGMRQLWHTGIMHNRVRMVAASFLVKNLGIDWRAGERWFWHTLVDADPAANPFNWQWVAGSGDDAAPYFRIFNPLVQAQRFDPKGQYRQRWLPVLDPQYPEEPLVDVLQSRLAALAAYDAMKNQQDKG